jgi:NAD(P)-dependent dehydrogenase (short-subunit alcohol dehydrogenase family)
MNAETADAAMADKPGSEVLPLSGKTAFVTGASRGIGASVARQLAEAGADVAINYRSKAPRAQQVADEIVALRRRALLLQGDITGVTDIASMLQQVQSQWQKLDILVLNASGGLEKDKGPGYAMRLNMTAQVNLVLGALPLLPRGGRIVFVTSHLAHFYGTKPVYDSYEPVAASKKAGEEALRTMIPDLTGLGVRLVVVSGDLIEGTITPKLLQRQSPGLIESRRQEAGSLPSVDDFAAAIVKAAGDDSYATGATIYVGSTDWG